MAYERLIYVSGRQVRRTRSMPRPAKVNRHHGVSENHNVKLSYSDSRKDIGLYDIRTVVYVFFRVAILEGHDVDTHRGQLAPEVQCGGRQTGSYCTR
jgi:hypothetical protein